MRRRLGLALRWALVVACSAFIFYLSSRTSLPAIGPEFPQKDKAGHIAAYALWAFLFSLALRATWPTLSGRAALLIAILGGVLYGASDELHQAFVPPREADLLDLLADGAGSFLGALLHRIAGYRNPWRVRRPADDAARRRG